MNLYIIHDKATDTYTTPVTVPSERDAIQSFTVVCNQPDTQYYKFPADYTLFQIGKFDQFTGKIELIEKKLITNASSLKEDSSIPQLTQSKIINAAIKKAAPKKKGKK